MSPMVVVYIPIRNNVSWCRSVVFPRGLKFIAFDNASTDGSGDVLKRRGLEVVSHGADVGRVANWAACVEHFVASGAPWMKWLFAGDTLDLDFARTAERAISSEPRARIILGDYVHVAADGRHRVRLFPSGRLVEPEEGLRLSALGNWFHAPINQMFHREAVADGFDYGPFVWGADFYFCMTAASRVPTLYWPHNFGEFHAISRAHFLSAPTTAHSLFEGACIREIATARLKTIAHGDGDHHALSARIESDVLRQLLARSASRNAGGRASLKVWRLLRRLRRTVGRSAAKKP